jgi:HEAT repeat protein
VWGLVSRPADAVTHIRAHLKPVMPVDAQHLARLIAELGSDQFLVRQKAGQDLQELGELAEGALEKVLAKPPSLEVRRRAEVLLQSLAKLHLSPKRLQAVRAIEALEHLGTPEAHALLRELSQGAPTVRITREARAAFERVSNRNTTSTK